ncbi:hypothetical protein YQE_03406, partial [Dendroctonus ponderosae]
LPSALYRSGVFEEDNLKSAPKDEKIRFFKLLPSCLDFFLHQKHISMRKEAEVNLALMLLFCWSGVAARGPHHPRDSLIQKRHVHYSPNRNSDKITQNQEMILDEVHLKEYMEEEAPNINVDNLTTAEQELYYFLLHDKDKNSKLDGFELLEALRHTLHGDNNYQAFLYYTDEEPYTSLDDKVFNRFTELVDRVLREDDTNHDGYLDYAEYAEARTKAKPKQPDQVQNE